MAHIVLRKVAKERIKLQHGGITKSALGEVFKNVRTCAAVNGALSGSLNWVYFRFIFKESC